MLTHNAKQSDSNTSNGFFDKSSQKESFFGEGQNGGETFFGQTLVQPKLTIGQPDDKYEQEADAMADQVVQKLSKPDTLQPKCASCEQEEGSIAPKLQTKAIFESNEEAPVQRKCEACKPSEIKPSSIQMSAGSLPNLQASNDLESRLSSSKGGGQPLAEDTQQSMSNAFRTDFSGVRVHTGSSSVQMNQELGARAFTNGSDIYFNSGEYSPKTSGGQHLLAHELTHVVQQGGVAKKSIQKSTGSANLDQLNEMLDRFNVPEDDVINLCGRLIASEKAVVLSGGYRSRMASALNVREMIRAVNNLGAVLSTKLEWVKEAAIALRMINYNEIRGIVQAAPQAERAVINTNYWKNFFVAVCTNETMVQALNDLNFDLQSKLTWLEAEMTVTSWELDYNKVKPWVTSASQAEKDVVKTNRWKDFFVAICTNTTMVEALNDLNFDLEVKLTWLEAEMTLTRLELHYATIKPWITAAGQAERDVLKTNRWKNFFVQVCTDDSMVETLADLSFDLKTKLEWLMAEWCFYSNFKKIITAATPADKATVLGDHGFLRKLKDYFWFWNDFAKTIELLGRTCPTGAQMIADGTVQAQLATAWTASNPAIVPAGGPVPPGVHEEGGFIYMNIITGILSTDSVAPGAQASLPLNNPNPPGDETILVGGYHTHPNVGPAWGAPFASPQDTAWATRNGIPLLFRGAFPAVANVSDGSTGPTRLHLAGDRGFPGTTGGLAPQALADGTYDEL